jgi:hypothetical protein
MSDATCPACAGDNLTDYPVCDTCATVAHFTHRATGMVILDFSSKKGCVGACTIFW